MFSHTCKFLTEFTPLQQISRKIKKLNTFLQKIIGGRFKIVEEFNQKSLCHIRLSFDTIERLYKMKYAVHMLYVL